ncbi:MAG: hypothetical protein JWO32_1390 [Bacteroidetes bacterium]|nr:hypothetical protein [Bacteroidota bacterium]
MNLKHVFLTLVFICSLSTMQSQSIIIYVTEKIKRAEIPVGRTEVDVTINDTLKLKRVSDNDGSLARIALPNGTYKVMVTNPEYNAGFEKEVIVKDYRTTETTIYVSKLSASEMEDKKKKK